MTLLAPWAVAAMVLASLGVALLHLLARDRPPRWLLPTARFVAAGTARATRRTRTPRDPLLLALRVLALLLAGAAFAGPVFAPAGGSVARIVLLDAAAGGDAPEAARSRLRPGDRLVLVDSTAQVVRAGAEQGSLDSLRRATEGRDRAHGRPVALSAALVAALRLGADVALDADSVALVLVGAWRGAEDDATLPIRRLWPGRVELVENAAPPTAPTAGRGHPIRVRGEAGDPLVIAARMAGGVPAGTGGAPAAGDGASDAGAGALLVRDTPTPADSGFAAAGGTLVVWPPGGGPDTRGDTVGGFVAGASAVLFSAARAGAPPAGEATARWIDGRPAVTSVPHGAGCIRTAALAVPAAGDLPLRAGFQAALRAILAPCAEERLPLSDSVRAAFGGGAPLAPAGTLRREATRSPATPWLLAGALLLLALEPLVRRARARDRVGEAGAVA